MQEVSHLATAHKRRGVDFAKLMYKHTTRAAVPANGSFPESTTATCPLVKNDCLDSRKLEGASHAE